MIWLIGCNGMLGSEVVKQLTEKKLPFIGTDKEVDITNMEALENFVKTVETNSYFHSEKLTRTQRQIKWIINCAAYTNVDKAEEDVELATKLNENAARNIARIARSINAKLIHISTDYVFDGTAKIPYTENSQINPIGAYGRTKAAGEIAIQKEMNQYYILRTAWLYGFDGKNFVYTMTNLMNSKDEIKVVNDQKGTPTFAGDLAELIIKIIIKAEKATSFFGRNSALSYGIYNFTNMGETTWFDFAQKIQEFGKKYQRITNNCVINSCNSQEFESKVERPKYSVLDKSKIIKELKIKIPEWQTSLEKFIKSNRFNNSEY
ncbi:MAG: dTDP-4-dehydrorhamnose reductase [Spirochaetaceae bacterium]|nr:dTDP-4-dehydrorhamnose reductase [Spirochaetaceae bacterium]